jgi:hypothetical protein
VAAASLAACLAALAAKNALDGLPTGMGGENNISSSFILESKYTKKT